MAAANRQTTIIVLFSALTVLASMGIRQSFGLFLQPISDSLDLGREVFSLAIALQNVVFGLPLFGMIADRYGARWVVLGGALLYAAGCLLVPTSSGPLGLHLTLGLIIGLFLFVPLTSFSALLFGGLIGFLWLATVPLTSGTVAQIFGARYLSTLYGIVFFSHQAGSFLGVWLAGWLYDSTGSYDSVWWLAIALGVVAALLHLPIADRPIQSSNA